ARAGDLGALPSFPTRRSSDLLDNQALCSVNTVAGTSTNQRSARDCRCCAKVSAAAGKRVSETPAAAKDTGNRACAAEFFTFDGALASFCSRAIVFIVIDASVCIEVLV